MDYCTLWFEGWWSHCCQAHDEAYVAQVGQLLADNALLQCVAESAPYPWLAVASAAVAGVMYAGVRLFGRRFYKRAAEKPMG